jgi:hypothetical protein
MEYWKVNSFNSNLQGVEKVFVDTISQIAVKAIVSGPDQEQLLLREAFMNIVYIKYLDWFTLDEK